MTATQALKLTPDKMSAMTDQEYKAAEDRLRRIAARQGLALQKSRRRHRWAPDYGGYRLIDVSTGMVAAWAGSTTFELRLDEIEQALLNRIECCRCGRAGTLDAPDYLEWERLPNGLDACPACLTPAERKKKRERDAIG